MIVYVHFVFLDRLGREKAKEIIGNFSHGVSKANWDFYPLPISERKERGSFPTPNQGKDDALSKPFLKI